MDLWRSGVSTPRANAMLHGDQPCAIDSSTVKLRWIANLAVRAGAGSRILPLHSARLPCRVARDRCRTCSLEPVRIAHSTRHGFRAEWQGMEAVACSEGASDLVPARRNIRLGLLFGTRSCARGVALERSGDSPPPRRRRGPRSVTTARARSLCQPATGWAWIGAVVRGERPGLGRCSRAPDRRRPRPSRRRRASRPSWTPASRPWATLCRAQGARVRGAARAEPRPLISTASTATRDLVRRRRSSIGSAARRRAPRSMRSICDRLPTQTDRACRSRFFGESARCDRCDLRTGTRRGRQRRSVKLGERRARRHAAGRSRSRPSSGARPG